MTVGHSPPSAPWLDLYVLACRMFENLAGGWRSDAKEQAGELVRWAESYTPTTADEQALVRACNGLFDFSIPWERRVQALGRCMPTMERKLFEILESVEAPGANPSSPPASPVLMPVQRLELLIAVNRVFDAVSCTFTGEARGYAADLRALASRLAIGTDPALADLAEAIAGVENTELPWEQRCQRLSRSLCPLESQLKDVIAALVHQVSEQPPAAPLKGAVYHWAREIHPSRREVVGSVLSTRAMLNVIATNPMGPAVHGWHWSLPPKRWLSAPTFLASLPSGISRIHPYVVTTREWFAKRVMSRALASARRRYPGWEQHRFVEGPRIGERRLVFESASAGLVDGHMEVAIRHYADRESANVHAFWAYRHTTPGSWQRHDPEALRVVTKRPPDNRVLLIVIDALEPTRDAVREAVTAWRTGVLPKRARSVHRFGFEDIADRLEWLTWPERVLLNWEPIACAELGDSEIALLEAASVLDVDAMEEALSGGANPNATHPEHGSALSAAINSEVDENDEQECIEPDDSATNRSERNRAIELLLRRGAHPDLHTPFNSPVLRDALARRDLDVVRKLLAHGADASIIETSIGAPTDPVVWDMALEILDRTHPEVRAVLRLLLDRRDSPLFTRTEENALKADLRRDAG
jgi:hypothetical protein